MADKLDVTLFLAADGPVTARDMIYGHGPQIEKGRHFMAHKTGFTATAVLTLLFGIAPAPLFDLCGRAIAASM